MALLWHLGWDGYGGVFLFRGYFWSRKAHACARVCVLWGKESVQAALMGGPCQSHVPRAQPPAFTFCSAPGRGQLTQGQVPIQPATYKLGGADPGGLMAEDSAEGHSPAPRRSATASTAGGHSRQGGDSPSS